MLTLSQVAMGEIEQVLLFSRILWRLITTPRLQLSKVTLLGALIVMYGGTVARTLVVERQVAKEIIVSFSWLEGSTSETNYERNYIVWSQLVMSSYLLTLIFAKYSGLSQKSAMPTFFISWVLFAFTLIVVLLDSMAING